MHNAVCKNNYLTINHSDQIPFAVMVNERIVGNLLNSLSTGYQILCVGEKHMASIIKNGTGLYEKKYPLNFEL